LKNSRKNDIIKTGDSMEIDNINKDELISQTKYLIDDTLPLISNLSNLSRLLYECFENVLWAGFYITDFNNPNELVLGPFQGPIACTKIKFNKGVCGKSAYNKKSLLVPNVHEFEGHIACSSLSNSEVVVPIIKDDFVYGVIDIDSTVFNNFTNEDVKILEEFAELISVLF
jgi:GAF domain-containing protein